MNELIVKEYLGSGIEFKVVNNEVYANATSMCKPFNKTPKDWLRTAQTQRYISALEQKANMPNEMVSKNKGGDINDQGTWIHERLVLRLASWLDIDMELWMDDTIATLLREGEVKIVKQDSYMIDNPVDRAKRWIEEYEEKLVLESKIQEDAPLVSLAEERLSFDDCVSITDVSRTFNIKRGYLTSWAKKNGYIHKTITEVNQAGLEYFKIYDNGGYKNIGITKKGLKFIEINLDEIKTK